MNRIWGFTPLQYGIMLFRECVSMQVSKHGSERESEWSKRGKAEKRNKRVSGMKQTSAPTQTSAAS